MTGPGTAGPRAPAPRNAVPVQGGCGGADILAANRRELVQCLLAANLRAADAAVGMLSAHGQTVLELFDEVLQPLLDEHAGRVQRQQAPPAALHALQRAVVRVIARLPLPPVERQRAPVLVVGVDRQDDLLSGWMLGLALEHRGYQVADLGHVALSQVSAYLAFRDVQPRVVVLVVDEASTEPARLRGDVRRLRQEIPGVRVVLTGRATLRDAGLAHLVGADGSAPQTGPGVLLVDALLQPLTAREVETLRLVAGGRTNRQIATALGIAPSTVKSSLDRVFEKLRTPDRASAAAVAVRSGWID